MSLRKTGDPVRKIRQLDCIRLGIKPWAQRWLAPAVAAACILLATSGRMRAAEPVRRPAAAQVVAASISGPDLADSGTTVTLLGRFKVVSGSPARAEYQWTQTGGPALKLPAAVLTTNALRFRALEAGSYSFSLKVTMGSATDTATKVVEVHPKATNGPSPSASTSSPPPILAQIQVAPAVAQFHPNVDLMMKAKASGGAPNATYTYLWEQLAGSPVSPPNNDWTKPYIIFLRVQFIAGMTYKFRLTVSSGDQKGVAEATIVPQSPPQPKPPSGA
ncbi:MAG TPA: hypothetical protein VG734_03990 [Lacunisphaera sp.]|nr:hypothetical protein [Lacunisphaera sp.]